MDISIIIVNYNVKDFLFQCLRSIEAASVGLTIEIFVVDNASDDNSIQYLTPIFPHVKFISLKENLGFARANNIGIDQAIGKYLLILNPDTILEEINLKKMKDYMDVNEDVAVSGCKVLNSDGSFQLACRRGFPTPWNSFCTLFGLQSLFPKSKLFAQYNQTYRNIDETYFIDSVIGAYMFCRADAIKQVNGFDTDFFMYGEDLDLCYRLKNKGWKISYFHETSIIHYKGESARRSAINEVKVFYNAMVIYAKKHYSSSVFFIFFLKLGIKIRELAAYFYKFKYQISNFLIDLIIINISLLIGTKVRFGRFFDFPSYAYPTVFLVISFVQFIAMMAVGEYFENKISLRKHLVALLATFFLLSSLTYFFQDYAFSRGILLMTIGFSIIFTLIYHGINSLISKTSGTESDKRIIIVGINKNTDKMIESLEKYLFNNTQIVGLVQSNDVEYNYVGNYPVIGNYRYLSKIIQDFKVHEVVITDKSISNKSLIDLITSRFSGVRFHIANEFDELLASKIIDEISGIEPSVPIYKLSLLRYKIIKRISDILISFFFLTIGFSIVNLIFDKKLSPYRYFWKIFKGEKSFIGIYPVLGDSSDIGKQGLIGIVHISSPERLSKKTIINLNDYYRKNYSLSLDLGLFFKFIFRKNNGK